MLHHLLWLLSTMRKKCNADSGEPALQIYPALLLARKNVRGHVTLEDAAKECGLSRSRFAEVFKSVMGIPFCRFASHEKIHALIHELQPGMSKTIRELAFEYGFTDICHFNRFFKKITGHTPSAFLKKM